MTTEQPHQQKHTATRALGLMDLTELGDACRDADVEALCTKAVTEYGNVAAVCVWPAFVPLANRLLAGAVQVACVVNFPHGQGSPETVAAETAEAVALGAGEIDVVVDWRRVARGETGVVAEQVAAAVRAADGRSVKAILETSELSLDDVRLAAREAAGAGAAFLKTSTGKVAGGASLEAVQVLLDVALEHGCGVKVSGGVRTVEQAGAYLTLADERAGAAWVTPARFRFGASGLFDAIAAAIDGAPGATGSSSY
jgi:deoxyribose-phosphate aldolase